MKWENNDANELLKSVNIKANNYIEIKENEAVTKIKKKWPLVDQIMSFVVKNSANRKDRTI